MRWLPILGLLAACGGGSGDDEGRPDGRRIDGNDPILPGWRDAPAVFGGPVQETAAVSVDGKVYVMGGFAGSEVTDAVRVYDTVAGTWSDGPSFPSPAHHASATVVDGTIYVLGMLEGLAFAPSGRTWALTPGVDTAWRERAPMPTGIERGAAVAGQVGTRILVAGGFAGGAVGTALAYDPVGNTWSEDVAPLPAPRDHACGVAYDGALYVVGGREAGTNDVRDTVFAFRGDSWTARTAMPTGRGGIACGFVNGELIVVGGEGNPDDPSGVFPQAEAYAITADRWRTVAPMPHPRHGMAAAAWGPHLYVPGGADVAGFGAVDTFEVLIP